MEQQAKPGPAQCSGVHTRRDDRPRSVVILDPAPLWRNAPTHGCHPGGLSSHQQRRQSPVSVASPAVSFQQSLRSYPSLHQPKTSAKPPVVVMRKDLGRSASSPHSKPRPSSVVGDNSRCHVTNLEGEQSTPFFLDYLNEQQNLVTNPVALPMGAFNHTRFMEMFREPDAAAAESRTSEPESGSLPYAINNELQANDRGASIRSGLDSLASDQSFPVQVVTGRQAPSAIQQQQRRTGGVSRRIASGGDSNLSAATPMAKCSFGKEISLSSARNHSSTVMENANSRSSSNLNQRLQSAAERRAQIEEAKRERVQRQIEHVPRPAPFATMAHASSQNPNVVFGSTRPRNIDLTRPLVTPIPNARPKSEIFSGSFYGPSTANFSKDDANYTSRSARTPIQSTPSVMSQSMSVSCIQPSTASSTATPSYRAARRHDPELVPAMQKYIFRDYAVPSSSGTPSLRKENSMISSMTSTKSFQANSFYRTPFGGPQNRPKKSFSMNRLDQLAQPRRRVEAKVPTSASFIRTKESLTSTAKKPASATESSDTRGPKPAPPPKRLNFSSPKPSVPNESGTASGGSSRAYSTPKPRPLSHIEISQSAPVFEEKATEMGGDTQEGGGDSAKDDRLAEYKRALAEKKAMFRKQQEEQQQTVPVRRAKIVKPEVLKVEVEEEEPQAASSSSSSSSSSSDSESDTEQGAAKKESKREVSLAPANEKAAVSEAASSNLDSQPEQLISFGTSDPLTPSNVNLMTTSLTSDLAMLAISGQDKALANASMTGSFDISQLSSATNSSQRAQSATLSKEQLEERSAKLLEQEKAEREKRKSRLQEIMKRTRKEEKKETEGEGKNNGNGSDSSCNSNGDSSQSETESLPTAAEESSTSNGIAGKYTASNGTSNGDASKGLTENHSNGHLNSTHHRDMKNYVNENEQSLPPTNGF